MDLNYSATTPRPPIKIIINDYPHALPGFRQGPAAQAPPSQGEAQNLQGAAGVGQAQEEDPRVVGRRQRRFSGEASEVVGEGKGEKEEELDQAVLLAIFQAQ